MLLNGALVRFRKFAEFLLQYVHATPYVPQSVTFQFTGVYPEGVDSGKATFIALVLADIL